MTLLEFCIASISSCLVFGFFCSTEFFNISQTFSMGFTSGELGGHCRNWRNWRCSDHGLTHWSIIQEYLAASACFHEIVNKLYVFCFSAATHERINVTCFEREVPCLYNVWISRTFVGSKIHNNPFCKSDIFFAHCQGILLGQSFV